MNMRSGAVKVGWATYQQIAAILGAFALIALLSHIVDMEWRGFLRTLIDQWNEYVRPATKWLLDLMIGYPLSWLGWQIEIPLFVRDYLSVGVVLIVAMARGLRYQPKDPQLRAYPPKPMTWQERVHIAFLTFVLVVIVIVAWPVFVFWLLYEPVPASWRSDKHPYAFALMSLAPLFYFGLLLVLNEVVLRS